MNRPISLICLVLGIVLLVYGISAADSLASSISEFFRGTPTDKSMLLIIAGLVLTIWGGFSATRRGHV